MSRKLKNKCLHGESGFSFSEKLFLSAVTGLPLLQLSSD
jgi:hypothetical protein